MKYGTFLRSHFVQLILVLATALMLQTLMGGRAYAATVTWDGGGTDFNWSTAENWLGDVSPVSGDTIVFPDGAITTTANDDGIDIGGLQLPEVLAAESGHVGINGSYTLSGQIEVDKNRSVTFDNVTLGSDLDVILDFDEVNIGSSGSVNFPNSEILDLNGYNLNAQMKGYTDINAADTALSYQNRLSRVSFGTVIASSPSSINANGVWLEFRNSLNAASLSAPINLEDSVLEIDNADDIGSSPVSFIQSRLHITDTSLPAGSLITIPNTLTFNGNLFGALNSDSYAIAKEAITTVGTFDLELSGDVSVNEDMIVSPSNTSGATQLEFSGTFNGGGVIGLDYGEDTLVISANPNNGFLPNGTYQGANSVTLTDSSAINVIISANSTLTVDGSRDYIVVSTGAELNGSGTVGDVVVQQQGTLGAGVSLSNGCLTTGSIDLSPGAILDFDVDTRDGSSPCTDYDQIIVNGTVDVTDASYTFGGYINGVEGETFIFINNDGTDPIIGTFFEEGEGAIVDYVVDGTGEIIPMKLSYVGGDGNDLTFQVLGASTTAPIVDTVDLPDAPDTGFIQLESANIFTAIAGLGVALIAAVAGTRRLLPAKK